MARGYTVPWKIGQVGLAEEVARKGFAELTPTNIPQFGPLRITFHGDWTKPATQFIRVEQVNNPNAHYISKLTWSNHGTANDNAIKAFREALGSITVGLGFNVDDFISLETGRRVAITRNYEQARQSLPTTNIN